VHNGIGGSFSKMWSPANPLFFVHHANVDRHYAIWQSAHPENAKDFPKPLTTQIPVYNVTVGSVMDIGQQPYCYTYTNMDIMNSGRSTAGLNRRSLVTRRQQQRLKRRSSSGSFTINEDLCYTKCGQMDEKTGIHYPPCDDDRQNMIDIRDVKPTPESWLAMNNLNVSKIRTYEKEHRSYIHALNKLPGYVSPSALYNRPKLLTNLVSRGQTNFFLYNENHTRQALECPLKLREQPTQIPGFLRSQVEQRYGVKGYGDVKDKLHDLLGDELAQTLIKCGNKFANNPYRERDSY